MLCQIYPRRHVDLKDNGVGKVHDETLYRYLVKSSL
jgi:hypothetical protein